MEVHLVTGDGARIRFPMVCIIRSEWITNSMMVSTDHIRACHQIRPTFTQCLPPCRIRSQQRYHLSITKILIRAGPRNQNPCLVVATSLICSPQHHPIPFNSDFLARASYPTSDCSTTTCFQSCQSSTAPSTSTRLCTLTRATGLPICTPSFVLFVQRPSFSWMIRLRNHRNSIRRNGQTIYSRMSAYENGRLLTMSRALRHSVS